MVVHPQSIVHSLVELRDGSMIAQLGVTDMRLPIQYAFSYPERWGAALPALDLARAAARWSSARRTSSAFPCLGLAYAALEAGGTRAVVLNAANEVAVDAFLEGRLGFTAIAARDRARAWTRTRPRRLPTTLATVRAVDRVGPGLRAAGRRAA